MTAYHKCNHSLLLALARVLGRTQVAAWVLAMVSGMSKMASLMPNGPGLGGVRCHSDSHSSHGTQHTHTHSYFIFQLLITFSSYLQHNAHLRTNSSGGCCKSPF